MKHLSLSDIMSWDGLDTLTLETQSVHVETLVCLHLGSDYKPLYVFNDSPYPIGGEEVTYFLHKAVADVYDSVTDTLDLEPRIVALTIHEHEALMSVGSRYAVCKPNTALNAKTNYTFISALLFRLAEHMLNRTFKYTKPFTVTELVKRGFFAVSNFKDRYYLIKLASKLRIKNEQARAVR